MRVLKNLFPLFFFIEKLKFRLIENWIFCFNLYNYYLHSFITNTLYFPFFYFFFQPTPLNTLRLHLFLLFILIFKKKAFPF